MSSEASAMERVSARISLVIILAVVFIILSISKMAGIQIMHHRDYMSRADRQQRVEVSVEARRGEIFDINGYLLAGNITEATFSVYWPNVPHDRTAEIDSLIVSLGTYSSCAVPVQRSPGNMILAEGVPWEYASQILDSASRYADCSFVTRRVYPMMEVMAPVIGMHNENISQGLEYQMEDILEGTDGVSHFQASGWAGYRAVDAGADNILPVHGRDLCLTIDSRYQEIAQGELEQAVEMSSSSWGAIVIIDPVNGDILAMASYPVFNEDGSLARNHCIQSSHEPGSVFKAVTLAAALDANTVTLSDSFDCTGSFIEICGYRIHDSHPIGEFLDLTGVIAQSSNVGTVQLASTMSDSIFYSYCRDFGFGRKSRVEFPGEQCGILRNVEDWLGLSKANLAIGQEVSATPLQIAMAYGVIANGGLLYRPRLVESTREDGLLRPLAESPAHRVISEETAAAVRSVLAAVVNEGTGGSAQVPGVTVAGKTGTAERLVEDGYLSAFAGMIPADDPHLVAVVIFDQPDYEYRWGSALAAPVFQRVISRVLSTTPEIALGKPQTMGEMIVAGGGL
ncbi:MAG: penicillin-binding protein 2 [Candidatus Sabulitectum sp.]|nr:penicillin-binding protein 2 [Candidatus Sabulitectum sp.]